MSHVLHSQGGPSHLSPAAAGGGIGRGGTPVISALHQGEAGAASPAPFAGHGPGVTSSPQMAHCPFNTGTGVQMLSYCHLVSPQC